APGLAADIAAAGHELGVHGWDHRYLPLRGPGATVRDLTRARDIIADAAGGAPRWFRPPYGVLSTPALAAARRLAPTPVLWPGWGGAWIRGATPGSVYAVLPAGLSGGGTALLPDSDGTCPPGSARAALGALPMLLDECARRGLRVGPLAEHWAASPGACRPADGGAASQVTAPSASTDPKPASAPPPATPPPPARAPRPARARPPATPPRPRPAPRPPRT